MKVERIYLDYNTFRACSPAYYFAQGTSFVFFDGATVFASATAQIHDCGGPSNDGMRMTAAHTETLYEGVGSEIPASSIPEEVMAYIREIYAARQTPPAASAQPAEAEQTITAQGVTHPVSVWRRGVYLTTAPTEAERRMFYEADLTSGPCSDGRWYVSVME